jgi:hypothetical protein
MMLGKPLQYKYKSNLMELNKIFQKSLHKEKDINNSNTMVNIFYTKPDIIEINEEIINEPNNKFFLGNLSTTRDNIILLIRIKNPHIILI